MHHDLPPLQELGDDLRRVGRLRTVTGLAIPFIAIAASVMAAHARMWWLMLPFAVASLFWSYASASHDLVHRNLRLPRPLGEALLIVLELLGLRSATAYRLAHLQHHRAYPDQSDIEGHEPSHSVSAALLAGVTMQPRQWLWAFRRHPRYRARLLLELALGMGLVGGAASLWRVTPGPAVHLIAVTVVGWGLPLATVFFVHRPQERDRLRQTRMFRGRLFEVLFAGHLYHLEHHLYPSVPHQNWAKLAGRLDSLLAARGIRPVDLRAGEESLPDPARAVPRAVRIGRFWLDYWITFLVFIPVILVRQLQAFARQAVATIVTYNRIVSLLDGRLEIVYCNSLQSLLLSTLFGGGFRSSATATS